MPRAKRATAPAKPAREPMVRVTVYASVDLANRLDRAQAELRALAGGHRAGIAASTILSVALSQALADFETNGEASALAREVLERVRPKQ